jgi:hypothetical protein
MPAVLCVLVNVLCDTVIKKPGTLVEQPTSANLAVLACLVCFCASVKHRSLNHVALSCGDDAATL